MININNVNVYNLENAIVTSGFPMLSKELTKEEKELRIENLKKYLNGELEDEQAIKDLKRAIVLGKTKSGEGHDNFLKGILVTFDLKYCNYWSMQFQRYHFADIVSSTSKMHRITKMDLNTSFNKYVDQTAIKLVKQYVDAYNVCLKEKVNSCDVITPIYSNAILKVVADDKTLLEVEDYDFIVENTKIKKTKYTNYELYMKIISNCPMGLEQTMGISTNYLQLKTIYLQRRHHKLKEDWGPFCAWCESLPLFVEITKVDRMFTDENGNLLNKDFNWEK